MDDHTKNFKARLYSNYDVEFYFTSASTTETTEPTSSRMTTINISSDSNNSMKLRHIR